MFKTISQIIILIVFLFLTIFVTVWFKDTGGNEEQVDSRQSLSWLSESAKITASILSAFFPKTDNAETDLHDFNMATSGQIDKTSSLMEKAPDMYNNVNDSASTFINNSTKDNNFREFVGNIMQKAPGYYLDMKMYNNAWKNFWSFYWLKFDESTQK